MTTDTDAAPDVAGMSDDELADVIAKVRERGAWKLVGATGQEDRIVDADRNTLFSAEHIPFRYAHQIAQMPAAIMVLAARLEAAERERDEAREATRWRTVREQQPPVSNWDVINPPPDKWVLLLSVNGHPSARVYAVQRRGGLIVWQCENVTSSYGPLHPDDYWLPLPQPPQGGA